MERGNNTDKNRKKLYSITSILVVRSGQLTRIIKERKGKSTPKEQLVELNRIARLYTKEFRLIDNTGTTREGEIVMSAVNFSIITFQLAQESGFKTQDLEKFADIRKRLRESSELRKVKEWLAEKREHMIAVEEGGEKEPFGKLWNLHYSELKEIKNLKRFRKKVSDHFTWFQFLNYTTRVYDHRQQRIIYSGGAGNKRKAFFAFLISLTLGVPLREFELGDVQKFLDELIHFSEWELVIQKNIENLISGGDMAHRIWSHDEMKNLVRRLSIPKNQTINYVARDIPLTQSARELSNTLIRVVDRTVWRISREALADYRNDSVVSGRARELSLRYFNRGFLKMKMSQLVEAFERWPSFGYWANTEVLFRAYLGLQDSTKERSIIEKFLDKQDLDTFNKILSSTITIRDFLRISSGLKEKTGFLSGYVDPKVFSETDYEELSLHKPKAKQSLFANDRAVRLFMENVGRFSLSRLQKDVRDLKNRYNIKLPLKDLDDDLVLGLFIYGDKKVLPKYVAEYVRVSHPWYQYIRNTRGKILIEHKIRSSIDAAVRGENEGTSEKDILRRDEELKKVEPLKNKLRIKLS